MILGQRHGFRLDFSLSIWTQATINHLFFQWYILAFVSELFHLSEGTRKAGYFIMPWITDEERLICTIHWASLLVYFLLQTNYMVICNLQHKAFRCHIKSIHHSLKRNVHFNAFIISLETKKEKGTVCCKVDKNPFKGCYLLFYCCYCRENSSNFKKSFLHDLLLCELIRRYGPSVHTTHREYLLPIWSLQGSCIRISMVASCEAKEVRELPDCCKTVTLTSCL